MLEVRGLQAQYDTRRGPLHAVNGVSFTVYDGEIVGLVGESGCGKSATIRAVLGLLRRPGRVTGGEVIFDGRDLLKLPPKQLRSVRGASIGFIAQNPFAALNPILRVDRQFYNAIRAHRKDVTRRESRGMAEKRLSEMGIADPTRVLDGWAHELSGGMSQRVVIALVTLLNPSLIVGDEPTTALDVTIQRQVLDLLHDVVLESNRSMLLVTHDLAVVSEYCSRVIVMYAGTVVEIGRVVDVFANPRHPYTKALLEAVPRRGQELRPLLGRVPDLVEYPVGCPFSSRCEFVRAECATPPQLVEDALGRSVACHVPAGQISA